jgi:hypothetical protein
MLPWDLEDWLSEVADRVLRAEHRLPQEELFREVWLFDTENGNGGMSQYFGNYPERWDQLTRLAAEWLPEFAPVAAAIREVISGAADPYEATLEHEEALDEIYDQHQVTIIKHLKEIVDAAQHADESGKPQDG